MISQGFLGNLGDLKSTPRSSVQACSGRRYEADCLLANLERIGSSHVADPWEIMKIHAFSSIFNEDH